MMGTGHRINGAPMPLMGLPYRRYSVPETVMRKYSLSRAQTSESSESGVATVPTPSVPSASFRNNSEGQWSPGRKSIHNKRMFHKACQTSPRVSVEKEISKSDSVTKEISCDNSDNEKTIPILHVTSEFCNDLDRKVSDSESSPKSGDCSQLYCEENEYYQTYDAKKHNCDVTIPGAINEPSSVFLIVESNNLDQEIIAEGETQVQKEISKTHNENKKIIDDLTKWISSEHIQYLLSNTTNTSILKKALHEKSKSFPETNKKFSVFNQRSCSAHGKFTTEEESGINDSDGNSIEQRTDSYCNDNTPTPIPPSTGQTEYHSSEGDCYVTDCEICTAEGRKCCNMDESYSQTFSFTSPEMVSTNGFKTSSDFTSSSVTLDQTVSDRSTSTQDSTLSITSITPESYNSKSTSINISPLLVINTETFLIEPVESGGRSRDFTFHPSDSTPRTTPSPSKSEELRDVTPQILNDIGECVTIPEVLNSESVLINPIQTSDVSINYALETIHSDHDISNDCKGQIEHAEYVIQSDDSQPVRIDLNEVDISKLGQSVHSSLHLINLNNIETNEERQMTDNNINITVEGDNNLAKEIDLNCSSETSIEIVNFQLDHSLKVLSPGKGKSDDENESIKDQAGDDFEMDSLAFEDTGSSEDVTITENKSNSFCGSENLIIKKTVAKNVNAGNIEDDVSSEDIDLLEQLGFCENTQKNKSRCSGSVDIETNYNEKCREQVQDMFYGNKKYELILKENRQNNNLGFKGNVMTTREEKSTSAITSNLDKSNSQGIPLTIDDNECMTEFSLIGRNDEFHNKKIILIKSDDKSMGSVTGGNYWESSGMEVIIPRYSAMPRTLSMLVNTSSMDYSSDSDLSLADSLEDTSISQRVNTSNKHDNRLVRGDVMALLPETGNISRKSFKESRAYFLSLAGEEGEIKTEPIPDELKKKLLKRDNEIKKHSDHSSKPIIKKQDSKRSKKYRHHSPIKHSTIMRKDKFGPLSISGFDIVEKSCKSTQWEDNASSRTESSDTLVPSDTSEKDVEKYSSVSKTYTKETNTLELQKPSYLEEANYNLNQTAGKKSVCNMSTNTDLEEIFQANNDSITKLDDHSEEPQSKDKSTTTDLNSDSELVENEHAQNLSAGSDSKQHIDTSIIEENIDVKLTKVNKWVQCIDSTFFDTKIDKEISEILLEAYNEDETDNAETKNEINTYTKDAVTTTDLEESFNGEVKDMESESNEEYVNNNLICSKSVQTDSTIPVEYNSFLRGDARKTTFSEMFQQTMNGSDNFLHENIPPSEAILLNSISNNKLNVEDSVEGNRCKTPVFGEKPTDKTVLSKQIRNGSKHFYNNKQGPRFSVRTTPSRRIGNLNNRFRQRFEVIPEEKNGSMDSSTEEKTISPPPLSSRRRSIPMEMLLMDGKAEKVSETTSSSDKQDEISAESKVPQFENHTETHRRHTIHGNLESQRNKTEYSNSFEKNEQNRRHTIHGNLSLTPRNTALIKKLNLMGGTVLKGRVFSKRSGVMIGQFRPMNEETQIEKDEKSAVGEQLERLRRGGCKGRQALAVTQNQEHEELLTLSKGWINFYLLKDSQELGSDGSNGEEGSQNSSSVEEKLGSKAPTVKTVTVVNKPEDKVRQYSVQIHAVPEQQTSETKLPDVKKRSIKSPKTPPQSPDCILPDITPTSSPNSPTPTLPDISKNELPQLQSDKQTSKVDKRKPCNHRSGRKKENRERLCPSPVDSEKSAEYLKLLSPKQDSENAFLTCSGDLACSEQSPSTITSSTCDSAAESPALPSIKWPTRNLHRRTHPRYHRTDSTKHAPQASNATVGQACWTVTLAGSSGCPTAPPPDVEMRLSFPNNPRGAPTSQSDSGLGEDNFQSHSEKKSKRQQALPPSSGKQWTLSIKNPQDEKRETTKVEKRQFQSLPDVSYQPSAGCSKKNAKRGSADHGSAQQLTIVWPKVQGILEQNLQRSLSVEWNEGLTVTGLAITPEQKPRVPTMSERDLTRNLYLRSRPRFSH